MLKKISISSSNYSIYCFLKKSAYGKVQMNLLIVRILFEIVLWSYFKGRNLKNFAYNINMVHLSCFFNSPVHLFWRMNYFKTDNSGWHNCKNLTFFHINFLYQLNCYLICIKKWVCISLLVKLDTLIGLLLGMMRNFNNQHNIKIMSTDHWKYSPILKEFNNLFWFDSSFLLIL